MHLVLSELHNHAPKESVTIVAIFQALLVHKELVNLVLQYSV